MIISQSLSVSNKAYTKVNNAILVTGSARSGTTVLGQLIHSFYGVEYSFEPPLVGTLLSIIESMKEDEWKLLYESYLYEDHFLGAISGRSINCNRKDDSSIYRVKAATDIENRLNHSFRKAEVQTIGDSFTLAYKMPDIISRVPKLLEYYPKTRVVISQRDPIGTISSLLKKRWFSEESLQNNIAPPFREYEGMQIPYWVKTEDFKSWCNMSELDRCSYYYLMAVRDVGKIPGRIEVKYNDLVTQPLEITQQLADSLNLKFGEKTMDIIATVKPTDSDKDPSIFDRMDPRLKSEILSLEQ